MLKLLLMRHGESTNNRDRRLTGQGNASLTALGHQQCQQLARWLHENAWLPTHVYSSPLRRALASLQDVVQPCQWQFEPPLHLNLDGMTLPEPLGLAAIATLPAPQLQICPALKEFNAGILTGLTWSEVRQQYPDLCHQLETKADWVPIPEAETPLQGRQRAQQFVQHLFDIHGNGDRVWVMAHHWILEHVIACLLGSDRTWQIAMPNTALFEFWVDCDRWHQTGMALNISDLWQIKQFNSTPHLVHPLPS